MSNNDLEKLTFEKAMKELEEIVDHLENMSISALKNKKLDIRKQILGAVKEAKLVIEKRLKK